MYVGRIVAVGRNRDGKLAGMYRVSSRSFPNREAQAKEEAVSIVPKQGFEGDVFKNPYIAYNCLRIVGRTAVVTNGSQTDPIAEKIGLGYPIRDAFITSMHALDYEKDQYNTPRIAAAVTLGGEEGFLGVVREDGLEVVRLPIEAGRCFYVATYGKHRISPHQTGEFEAANASDAAGFILGKGVFADMTNAVTAACVMEMDGGFEIAIAQA